MKHYLVIGGSSGIGRAVVDDLKKGENVVIATYNTNARTEEGIDYYKYDVLSDTFDFVPESLDGLVYAPGTINLSPFHRIKPEAFVDDYQIQVVGAIKVLQACRQALIRGGGSVVLFSTVAVRKGYNFHSQVSASKGAIEGLAISLAAEWAPDVRVNVVAPSITDTPLASRLLNNEQKRIASAERHPLKRIGSPEDVASMVTFLLSDASQWITGQSFQVDGGISSISL